MKRFATTLDYIGDDRWSSQATIIPPSKTAPEELLSFFRVLHAAYTHPVLVLDSSSGHFHPDILVAALIGLLPRRKRPKIIISGCMWQRDKGLRGKFQEIIARLADRVVDFYAVQSSEELTLMPDTWRVDAAKIRLCPYFATIKPNDITAPLPDETGYIFAGGDAHRNYDLLVEAARQMPNTRFIVASSRLNGAANLPANVQAGRVSHSEFMSLMRGATAVVTPLLHHGMTRAAGQQTYLNAMWLGIPSIVTAAHGVRDHIVDGQNGFIIDSTTQSLLDRLHWVLNPNNAQQLEQINTAAKKIVREQFTFTHHVTRLLEIVDEAHNRPTP